MAPFYPWRPLCPLPRLGAAARRLVSCASSPPAPDSAADPLRILFCGSDAFSCASLRALHAEQTRNRPLIASIDVMVLPPKRTGRGLKRWRNGQDAAPRPPDTLAPIPRAALAPSPLTPGRAPD